MATNLSSLLAWSILLPLTTCLSHAETQAKVMLDKASLSDPGAKGLHDLCGIVGKTDLQCRNTFFRDHRGKSSISMQATVNCMSQIEATQQQLAALTTALNTDPSDMAKYGHSSSGGVKWIKGENGGEYTRDPSPADIEVAAGRGRRQGELVAAVAWTTTYIALTVGYGGIDQEVELIGASEFSSGIGDMAVAALGSQEAYEAVIGDIFEADARKNPQNYLEDNEMTGKCPRYEQPCHGADGKEYYNNHQETKNPSAPSTVEPGEDDLFGKAGGLDTNPIPGGDDTSGVDPDGFWNGGEIMDIPDGTVTTIDPDRDPQAFLKSCVAKEERNIFRQIGSTRTVFDSRGPLTEEEKRQSAGSNLRRGMCDKQYFGEEYCTKWKQEKWKVPITPEQQAERQSIRSIRMAACPRPGGALSAMSCEKAKQELDKRYTFNELGDMMVGAVFSPQSGPPVKQFLPVDFGRRTVTAGGARPGGLAPGNPFLPPVQVAPPPPAGVVKPSFTRLRETLTTVRRPVVTPRPGMTTRFTRIVAPHTTIRIPFPRPE